MLIALYNRDCKDDNCTRETEAASSGWFDSHPSLSERLSLQGNYLAFSHAISSSSCVTIRVVSWCVSVMSLTRVFLRLFS